MRLLLAEDDMYLGQATCKGLMQMGYAVDWLTTGARLAAAVQTYSYDCILLDLGLPEVTGEACLQGLRRAKDATPVIILTASDGRESRIQLLDLGADDYLCKPFDLDELGARVRAVVRRATSTRQQGDEVDLAVGRLVLRVRTQSVLLDGEPRMLTNKEFWVLETLIRHRDRIVTRQMLEEALYGWGEELSSNAIEVYIYQLRRKLGASLIKTVRGVGYRLDSTHDD